MWKLIKFFVGVLVFGMLTYGFVTVPFGEKTLLGHFLQISETDEAQDLKKEVTRKIETAAVEIKSGVASATSETQAVATNPTLKGGELSEAQPPRDNEHLSNAEKDALRKLLGEKLSQN